jgi:hypothetical protein
VKSGVQTLSLTVKCLQTDNDKIAAIINRLCKSLVNVLSRTQGTLVYIVLVVLGLYVTRQHFRHSIAGLLALALSTSLFARGQFWDFLGYTLVDSSQDHGRIQITRRDVHSRTIQLRVSGEAIFLDRLLVHFDDGTFQELIVNDRILPGTRNYAIDLLGERSLESVELWYYKEPWAHNPKVCLYGVRSPEGDGQIITQDH